MAITSSGLYMDFFKRALENTNNIVITDSGVKGFLVSDSASPGYSAGSVAYADLSAYEVTGTGWAAGGIQLVNPYLTVTGWTGGYLVWDADNVTAAPVTITNAMGYVPYDDSAGDLCVCLIDFVTVATTVHGILTITWTAPSSGGIWYIDVSP